MSVSWLSLTLVLMCHLFIYYFLLVGLCVSRKVAMKEASMFNLTRLPPTICYENASLSLSCYV